MFSHWRTILIVALLAALLGPAPRLAQVQAGPQYTPWYELKDGEAQVHLYFFWSKTCPHCQHAHPFIEALPQHNDVTTAPGLLAVTLLLTGVLVWADRHWRHPLDKQVDKQAHKPH